MVCESGTIEKEGEDILRIFSNRARGGGGGGG